MKRQLAEVVRCRTVSDHSRQFAERRGELVSAIWPEQRSTYTTCCLGTGVAVHRPAAPKRPVRELFGGHYGGPHPFRGTTLARRAVYAGFVGGQHGDGSDLEIAAGGPGGLRGHCTDREVVRRCSYGVEHAGERL